MAAGLILPANRECLPEAVPADFEGIILCAATCPSIGNIFQKQFLLKLYFFGGQGLDSADRTRSGFGAGTSPATRADAGTIRATAGTTRTAAGTTPAMQFLPNIKAITPASSATKRRLGFFLSTPSVCTHAHIGLSVLYFSERLEPSCCRQLSAI